MKKTVIYSLVAILLFSACSTKLDVVGNYKETMVVYGLLDQSQTTQYIKINKAFLGEGNALTYAQIKDSTQYANALNVVIKRIKGGVELSSYNLTPDNTIPKNAGTFYGPDQTNVIYSFSTPLGPSDPLNIDSQYKLIIKNTNTGKEVSAQTSLLNDATFTLPNPSSASSSFSIIKKNTSDDANFQVQWYSGKNVRAYQMIIRFHYTDSLSGSTKTDSLDWVFPGQKTQTLAGGELMIGDFRAQGLLQFIGNQLRVYPTLLARRSGKVDIILVAAANDLNTFIEVNSPSTGIIQERPEFSNITNGLGIFSARYFKKPFGKPMDANSLDSLACGRYTKNLLFINSKSQIDATGRPVICP